MHKMICKGLCSADNWDPSITSFSSFENKFFFLWIFPIELK